jgi:selenide,water dikinase
VMPEAVEHVKAGIFTGASTRNWKGYGNEVTPKGLQEWEKHLLTDPQTSGGLLVACSPESEAQVLEVFRRHGFDAARTIGSFSAGAGLTVAV